MTKRYAIVRDNKVENVVEWDGDADWTAPEGSEAHPCGPEVGIGWSLIEGSWSRWTRAETLALVDAERDRRIDDGFVFAGHTFQSRPSDRENVMGAAQLAIAAISQGAQAGDLRWANPDQDFVWITADNQLVPLDAQSTVALFQTGVAFKSALTFHARGLKDAILAADDPASIDIMDGWPA